MHERRCLRQEFCVQANFWGHNPANSQPFAQRVKPNLGFQDQGPINAATLRSGTQQRPPDSGVEDLAQALQQIMHQNPAGGIEISKMLRSLADEVGGESKSPRARYSATLPHQGLYSHSSIFDDTPEKVSSATTNGAVPKTDAAPSLQKVRLAMDRTQR